jgi:WD40 repeat protein
VLRLWNARTGQVIRTLPGHRYAINTVAFSPDGNRLVSCAATYSPESSPGEVKIWNVEDGRELFAEEGDAAWDAAFTADGALVVLGNQDGSVTLRPISGDGETRLLDGHATAVQSVAVSPDGRLIASGDFSGKIKIWDAATGEELDELGEPSAHGQSVDSLMFDSDGRRLVSGSRDLTAKVWDTESGRELLRLEGHTGHVNSASFNTDGRRIVTGSTDGTVKVWESKGGEELLSLAGHRDTVNSAVFGPAGRWIVSAGSDGTLKLWDSR